MKVYPFNCVNPLSCGGVVYPHALQKPTPLEQLGRWTPVIHWQGITTGVRSIRVTMTAPDPKTRVEWRRWGGAIVPYASGHLSTVEQFHIYPGDLFLSIDLRSHEPGVEVTVEPL